MKPLAPTAVIPIKKPEILANLQADILRLQGFKIAPAGSADWGLGPIKDAFPNSTFPLGAVHEFLTTGSEDAAASSGFMAGLLSSLMGARGISLWISSSRKLFPPALKNFGIHPDHFIFIDLQKERDVLWTLDEALKCSTLTTVVGEVKEISFKASRRLQLAVEKSQVTGFIIRNTIQNPGTTACVSRWKITHLPSESAGDLPGIGFPKWKIELLRIRNGKPGVWNMQWVNDRFLITDDKNYSTFGSTEKLFGNEHKKAS